MSTPATPIDGAVLDAALRQITRQRHQPHHPWAAIPALGGRTLDAIVHSVDAADDATIAALLHRCHQNDSLASVVLLAGMHDHLFRRAYMNAHGFPPPEVVDEHATLAYLVFLDADPTQTRLLAKLLGRVTSRYRKRAATDTATINRQVATIRGRDGNTIPILDLLADPHPSVETTVEARLKLQHVLELVRDAIADNQLRPDAWHAFIERRLGGHGAETIAGDRANPSTIRSQIHRTAQWLAGHDCAA